MQSHPRLPKGKVKLERALSKLGLASRSEAQRLIRDGLVTVNGSVKKDPRLLVTPEKIKITIDGKLAGKQERVVLVLNKPRGLVTTTADEKGRATVFSLLHDRKEKLHAVGRLDLATTGLLLLTNDTKISSYLTDPKNQIERVYVVTVRGRVTEQTADDLLRGITNKAEQLGADKIEILKASEKETHLKVTLTEGKNREIRRLFQTVGHEVTRLKRIRFGPQELGDLQLGEYRTLTQTEIQALTQVVAKR